MKKKILFDVSQEITEDFAFCYQIAGRHLSKQSDTILWIKTSLAGPSLEHLSFRMGNQMFFIQIEGVDNNLACPGQREAFLEKAKSWNAHALIMPMKKIGAKWEPFLPNWGLEDAITGKPVIPPALITDQEIEITDNELHDFAILVVKNLLIKEGKTIISSQNDPKINPSIFFDDEKGKTSWVIVSADRYPRTATRPDDIEEIAQYRQLVKYSGYFASVSVVSADNPKLGRLLRGEGYNVKYQGLEAILKSGSAPMKSGAHKKSLMDDFATAAKVKGGKPNTTSLNQSIKMAHEQLLGKIVPKTKVATIARKLNDGPMTYSNDDLAFSVALNFFKNKDYIKSLATQQLMARLALIESSGKENVNPLLATAFENALYKLYK